jgi:hypothetical protein
MRLFSYLVVFFMSFSLLASAQVKEQTAWLALNNSTRFNPRWGMSVDIQFRSADDLEYIRNFMFRPGIVYHLNKNNNLSLGYMLNDTYVRAVGVPDNTLTEHRIWEQFVHSQHIKAITLSHRLRVEQRFIERAADHVFAQRLRYALKAQIPVARQDSSFVKGVFLGLQDEVFFHLQNKDKLNGSTFDQNRLYFGAGYRFSKKVDIEAGYVNQYSHGRTTNTSNNVIQLSLSTRF